MKTAIPVRVLIGDVHADAWELRAALEDDERFVVCAQTSEAAETIDAALTLLPELILISVEHDGGGVAATREIVARLPNVKVVMVADDDRQLLSSLRAGAEGYLLRGDGSERLPDTLWGAVAGTSVAMAPALVYRMITGFRDPNALRRTIEDGNALTSREWQIQSLLRDGLTPVEISERLSISAATVRSHRRHIRRKLDG